MIELVEDRLDIDTYLELRQSVQFRELTRDQAKKGLSNSLYTLVAFKDGKNEEARIQMSVAALEAGIAFNNASVTIIHGMSRQSVHCSM